MKIEERLQTDLMAAVKERNEVKASALRSVKTAIQVEKTNGKYHELTDDDVVKIIQKQVKQRLESEQIYLQASTPRYDLAERENLERTYLESYLPAMLSEDSLHSVIDYIIIEMDAKSMKDMGKVMKNLQENYANRYDGKVASAYIKSKFI